MSCSFEVGCCSDDAPSGKVGAVLLGRIFGSDGSDAGGPFGSAGLILFGRRSSSGEINVGAHAVGLKRPRAAHSKSADD